MKFIDISWPISEKSTEYKNRETISFSYLSKNNSTESTFCMGTHTGTHVDAPRHFLKDGKTINQLNLNKLMGPCLVLDLTNVKEKITAQDLQKFEIKAEQRILLKTKNSFLEPTEKFNPNFIYLDKSGAEYLASKNITAVGIDYLGIERNQTEHSTHKTLFNNDITKIEGLRLKDASSQEYFLVCLPLKFIDKEAAPARAILLTQP